MRAAPANPSLAHPHPSTVPGCPSQGSTPPASPNSNPGPQIQASVCLAIEPSLLHPNNEVLLVLTAPACRKGALRLPTQCSKLMLRPCTSRGCTDTPGLEHKAHQN